MPRLSSGECSALTRCASSSSSTTSCASRVSITESTERSCAISTFSALAIAAEQWHAAFERVREFRRELRRRDGIPVRTEFHAWKFVSGRGCLGDRIVPKGRRCQIFKDALQLVANLPSARLFNAVFPLKGDELAFELMVNSINRTLQAWDSRAVLVCDEGKESAYTRIARRLGGYNPIPDQLGTWQDSAEMTKNIPTVRVIEDPFFKKSERSYFIQLVDFCAYALLRRERPVASKTKYGLDQAFNLLAPILVREACPKNKEGIIVP